MQGREGAPGEMQVRIQVGEDEGEDGVRGGDAGGEKRSVVGEDGRGGKRAGEGKDVIF